MKKNRIDFIRFRRTDGRTDGRQTIFFYFRVANPKGKKYQNDEMMLASGTIISGYNRFRT